MAKLADAGSKGHFVWVQQAGSTSAADVSALAVNGSSVYVAGYFHGRTAGFGPATLTNAGFINIFVAKLTDAGSTGRFVWAQQAGGTSVDQATALAVSGTSVYVAGYFSSPTAAFGSATLTTAGGNDVFVARLTDAGNTGRFVWAQRTGGPNKEQATALAVSGSSVYVTGYFGSSTVAFGPAVLTSAGTTDLFVAKLTDAGRFVWAQRAGGVGVDIARTMAVSGTSVYVAGDFRSPTADFGLATLTNALNTDYSPDVFVAKLADDGSTGRFVWAQRAGGIGVEQATSLAVSGTRMYVAGHFFSSPTTIFGATTLANPSPSPYLGFLASLIIP
ncbi:hypothetical protein I2H31_03245 [Hymenobacter sp. BT662]|uniref:Uncharacterized protein n=1 Tax=Hymenobacter ruricola TaxID=2791023 RepID=A0ABS0I0M6_9BACT|nr:hypothetical protein [Hymenobacter ruricola]